MWLGVIIIAIVGLGGIAVLYGEFRKKTLKKIDAICGSAVIVFVGVAASLIWYLST